MATDQDAAQRSAETAGGSAASAGPGAPAAGRPGTLSPELVALLEALPEQAVLTDPQGHILHANQRFCSELGADAARLVGRRCSDLSRALVGPGAGLLVDRALREGAGAEEQFFDAAAERCINAAIYPVGEPGAAVGFIHLMRPLSTGGGPSPDLMAARHAHELNETLSALLSISMLDISFDQQLGLILERILALPSIDAVSRGAIFLVEDDGSALGLRADHGLHPEARQRCGKLRLDQGCLCARAARSRRIRFSGPGEVQGSCVAGSQAEGHRQVCVPVVASGDLQGLLWLDLRLDAQSETTLLFFLEGIANVLAGIVSRRRVESELKRSVRQLRRAMEATVELMALTVETRDPYTASHQRRVASLARDIAREMRLPPDRIEAIRMAGVVHDLGKLSVPAEILSKPGKLTKIEFSLIQTHSQVGHDMLGMVELPWPLAGLILQHHERIDGSGYPNGLRGDQIALEARVLSVADVVEAIASHRPYRPALGTDKALRHVLEERGRLYDPAVVDACMRVFQDEDFEFRAVTSAFALKG